MASQPRVLEERPWGSTYEDWGIAQDRGEGGVVAGDVTPRNSDDHCGDREAPHWGEGLRSLHFTWDTSQLPEKPSDFGFHLDGLGGAGGLPCSAWCGPDMDSGGQCQAVGGPESCMEGDVRRRKELTT